LRKLVHALPEPFRVHAEAASTAIISDPLGWGSTTVARPAPPALDDLQSAVIEAAQMRIGYTDRQRNVTERVVHPLGLATKGQIWYLVADTSAGLRTFRVDRVSAWERTGEAALRPPGFVLAEAWKLIAEDVSKRRIGLWAHGSATPGSLWVMRSVLGDRLRIGGTGEDGRVEVEIGGMDATSLAGSIAGFSATLHIDGPLEVREALARTARELAAMYLPVPAAARA
jgi:predicted DNA-binding transcriptional regulator YafY